MIRILCAVLALATCFSAAFISHRATAQIERRTYVEPARIRQVRALLDKVVDAYKLDDFLSDVALLVERVVVPAALDIAEEEARKTNDDAALRRIAMTRSYAPRLASELKTIISLQRSTFLNDLAYTLAADFQDQDLQAAEDFLLSEGMRRYAEALRGVVKALLIVHPSDVESLAAYVQSPEARRLGDQLASPRMEKLLHKWYVVIVSSISPDIRDALQIPDEPR